MRTVIFSLPSSLVLASTFVLASGCGDEETTVLPPDDTTPNLTTLRSGLLAGDGAGGAPDASGGISVGQADDGRLFVALGNDFAQEMGPGDTQIILANSADNVDVQRMAGAAVSPAIGPVPNGFSGAAAYAVPDGVDVNAFSHIIVWCPTAGVNFGAAALDGGATPVVVRTATLVGDGAGGAPDATGAVEVMRTGSALSLRFGDDFMQEMGPGDTQVFLARSADNVDVQRGADAASVSSALGTITNGASGEQSFDLPAGTDLDGFDYVIVWCPTAGVNFGAAELPRRAGTLAGDGAGGAPDASGAVSFSRDANGQLSIDLGADFMQEMGPGDTQLILARSDANVDEQRTADAGAASASLGTITNGASGAMSFAVPANVDVDGFDYVIVWCPTAGVNFGAARLN